MTDNPFDLSGHVALITGGNSGIGLGMAEALAKAGADVCIWGRNEGKNRAAEEKLKAHGHKALALKCDVADSGNVDDCLAETVSALGRVDSCFANAGVGQRGTKFHEITDQEWREITAINLDGVFFTLRAVVRHMVERSGGGSLVVTSSLSSIQGMPRGQHYAGTKAAVTAMARGLAVEYARHGIRANSIVPGWIESDMTTGYFNSDIFADKVLPRIPMRRWGLPSDFGGLAVYLAGEASRYHTGDTFVIDGAYSLF